MTAGRWMGVPRTPCVAAFLVALCSVPVHAQDGNLIEYSYGGFADGDSHFGGPMLLPPMVKIYQDGRIVFLGEGGAWQGNLGEQELRRYKAKLAKEPLLKETRLVPVTKGDPPGMHGGMAYIRYLDGQGEIVLGAMRLPTSGPWKRIVDGIRSHLPSRYSTFDAPSVSVRVYRGNKGDTLAWPFGDTLPLASHADHSLAVDDPRQAHFILTHSRGGFSWLECGIVDGGQAYSLQVQSVPGWYEPRRLQRLLGGLAADQEK